MTTPGALEIIRDLRDYRPDMFVGVGTVLDAVTARLAILAGADYVVCPVFDGPTVDICRQYSVAVMPGGLTPTEVANAWGAGADIVKVFPGRIATPEYVADLKAPMPQIKMMPTMEMTPEKACAYIRAGAVGIGVGSSIFDPQAMASGRFEVLTNAARSFVQAVSDEIRGEA
jgi:2-dehydro-3-deoxyphosphogluconate aldolase/(4S)-4-hydroxy-2-oxoglutarate aldolase